MNRFVVEIFSFYVLSIYNLVSIKTTVEAIKLLYRTVHHQPPPLQRPLQRPLQPPLQPPPLQRPLQRPQQPPPLQRPQQNRQRQPPLQRPQQNRQRQPPLQRPQQNRQRQPPQPLRVIHLLKLSRHICSKTIIFRVHLSI